MASKPAASAESDYELPWHGDFAGNATDGILLLIGGLLTLCALSGAWWMLWHALFWTALSSLVFFNATTRPFRRSLARYTFP